MSNYGRIKLSRKEEESPCWGKGKENVAINKNPKAGLGKISKRNPHSSWAFHDIDQ